MGLLPYIVATASRLLSYGDGDVPKEINVLPTEYRHEITINPVTPNKREATLYGASDGLSETDVPKDGFYRLTEKDAMGEDREALLIVFTHSSDWGDDLDARLQGLKRARAVTPNKPYISLIARNSRKHIDPTTDDITYKVAVFTSRICSRRGKKSFDNFLSGIPDYPE